VTRVVLHSNIFVAGKEFRGIPLRLLEQARAGEFEVAISTPIIEEMKRVLREKFNCSESRLEQFGRNISRFTRSGMGKRGGARVIYILRNDEFSIFLITAYAKNE
jgi:hypothetical protein